MSYTLRLTNGRILVTLADQETDSVTTSLTLIGKNVNAYGTDINSNYVHLLENFANVTEPKSPLVGQLWFNTLEQRMYFYDNSSQFKPVGGPIVLNEQPVGLVAGDLWIDTKARQLKFYDGTNLVTAGPSYDYSLGKSGLLTETVKDTTSIDKVVGNLYSNGTLVGVVSETAFNLRSDFASTAGFSAVGKGITAAPGMKFYGTATNAEALGDIPASSVLISTTGTLQSLDGPLDIYDDDGISIGELNDLQMYVDVDNNRAATIAVGAVQDFNLYVQSTSNPTLPLISYNTVTNRVGILTDSPDETVTIGGNVSIQGGLNVVGTTTYVYTSDLRIEDQLIELAYTTGTATDSYANGGGIKLYGTTDKTFTWGQVNESWISSENINLATTKTFKIGGQDVLSETTLGITVANAPGLTSVGTLNELNAGQLYLNTASIGLQTSVSTEIVIGAGSTTAIDFNNKKLKNIRATSVLDTPDTVATKGYVDSVVDVVNSGKFGLNIDVTGYANSTEDPNLDNFVIAMLSIMLPPGDPAPYAVPENSRARVLVTRTQTSATVAISDPIGFVPVNVYQAGTTNVLDVVQYNANYVVPTTFPVAPLNISRAVKQYLVSGGTWVRYIYTGTTNTVYSDGTW